MGEQVATKEEVQQALRRFQEKGGLVKKLPPEVVPPGNMVGAPYGPYEHLFYDWRRDRRS